jgi:hypothetical protein
VKSRRRVDLAGQHRFDCLADLACLGGLRDEALGPVAKRSRNGLRVVVSRDDRDWQPGPAAAHVRERIEPLRARHVEVEQQQVGVRSNLDGSEQGGD